MADETLLVLLLGGLHLLGFGFAALLLLPCLRDEQLPRWAQPGEDEDGGGGNDRIGPRAPTGPSGGGIPLPDAVPARVRLRERGRLADLLPQTDRRPAHAPAPVRSPTRSPQRARDR
ncbi:MAG: hypothetical protein JWQ48_273 [Conexibacter sp.]|jgi:hypothetical protein|nr:hypothetical protein [Conexibacter sp.]